MMTLRSQVVNVNRQDLIKALETSLDNHRVQYAEAEGDYKVAVQVFLTQALERARSGDYSKVKLEIDPPVNRENEYLEVIEMLKVSVDETIQLDRDSYKAYYKNEWSWSRNFMETAMLYKALGASQ